MGGREGRVEGSRPAIKLRKVDLFSREDLAPVLTKQGRHALWARNDLVTRRVKNGRKRRGSPRFNARETSEEVVPLAFGDLLRTSGGGSVSLLNERKSVLSSQLGSMAVQGVQRSTQVSQSGERSDRANLRIAKRKRQASRPVAKARMLDDAKHT